MKNLILMVGLPRSGKTTWARGLLDVPIVSPDEIRLALHGQRYFFQAEPMVWYFARIMVVSLFAAGHETVVLDSTSITKARRDEWRGAEWETWFQEITTPAETCIQRATVENDQDIIPIITGMDAKRDPLTAEEESHRVRNMPNFFYGEAPELNIKGDPNDQN